MGLPASQRRALNQIEKALADDHPSLGPLFAVFARLAGQEAMPVTERVTARRWWQPWWQRRMWPAVATVIGLAMITGALLTLSLRLPGPQVCKDTVVAVAAHVRSVPTVGRPACATRFP
jgi:hypothetical protein